MKIFSEIAEIIPTLAGGTWPHQVIKCQTLAALIIGTKPKVVVEIGVFGGASLIAMALAVRENGSGICIGIDPWEASASTQGQTGGNLEWWSKLDHDAIMRDFISKMNTVGVPHVIQVVRSRSDDVTPPKAIDIFHCDGNHGPQAVRDVERFAPNVVMGGFAVLDDLDWSGGAVREAENRLFSLGFKILYALGTGAVYQKVKA